MIYAEHGWKTNPQGEPLAKYFNDAQWSATYPVTVMINGEKKEFPNSGWIATESPTVADPEPAPEPLQKAIKKVTPKKTTRKRKTKT